MYFGSVRFFKHLILGTIAVTFITFVTIIVLLSMQVIDNNETIDQLENQINEMQITIDGFVSTEAEAAELAKPPADMEYPVLYTAPPTEVEPMPPNTVYLTFDDGPTAYTDQILDILAYYDVQATFFVVGTQVLKYPETVQRMVDEGHAIGLHSNSHKYENVYGSVDSFLNEYESCLKAVQSVTDYPVTTVRFPGGTNTSFTNGFAPQLVEEMTSRGFAIFDWNVDSEDAVDNNITSEEITENVVSGCEGKTNPIILMHDTSQETVDSLDETIEMLENMGFQFGVLSNKIEPMHFRAD